MTVTNRELAIKETLKYEGGYSNNPSDPGGPTNWGITLGDARVHWKSDATAADVRNMPLDVAVNIYREKYWKTNVYDCDTLASGVDFAVFDFGVNSGPGMGKKALVASIGGSDVETINKIFDYRLRFLQQLNTWPVFGRGWTTRCNQGRTFALQLNAQSKVQKQTTVSATKTAVGVGAAAAITHVAVTQPHRLWPWLIGGIVAAGLVAWVLTHIYGKKETNVPVVKG